MQDKIIEIIVLILSEMGNNKLINEIDISGLNKNGYTEAEINTAFAWIYSRIESNETIYNSGSSVSKSHRIFHKVEKQIFTPNAIGYLIQMKELGIISDLDKELIIDKIIGAGYQKAGVDEVKLILSSILFDNEEGTNDLSRLVFQNNETIH